MSVTVSIGTSYLTPRYYTEDELFNDTSLRYKAFKLVSAGLDPDRYLVAGPAHRSGVVNNLVMFATSGVVEQLIKRETSTRKFVLCDEAVTITFNNP